MDTVTEIATSRPFFGSLVLAGLTALVAYMGRKIWLDASDKECQRTFGFWPERPLAPDQVSAMERVVGGWSQEFHDLAKTKIDLERANRTTEAGLLSDDVEYAEMNLSITLARAKAVAKRYADDPIAVTNRLQQIANYG